MHTPITFTRNFILLVLLTLLIPLWGRQNTNYSETKIFSNAVRLNAKQQYTKALPLFLKILTNSKNTRYLAYAAAFTGQIRLKQYKPKLALVRFAQALADANKLKNQQLQHFSLFHMAVCYRMLAKQLLALKQINLALSLTHRKKLKAKRRETIFEKIKILIALRDWRKLLLLLQNSPHSSRSIYATQSATLLLQNNPEIETAKLALTIIKNFIGKKKVSQQLLLAQTYLILEQADDANKLLSPLKKRPITQAQRSKLAILHAELLHKQGHPSLAANMLIKAAKKCKKEKQSLLYNKAAVILFQVGAYNRAGKLFYKALHNAPHTRIALLQLNLAKLHLFQGRLDRALKFAKKAHQKFHSQYNHSSTKKANSIITHILLKQKKAVAAMKWLSRHKSETQTDAEQQLLLAELAYQTKQYSKALQYAQTALRKAIKNKQQKTTISSHNLLALTLKEQNEYSAAASHYNEALTLNKKLHDKIMELILRHNLGVLHLQTKKTAAAIKELTSAVKLLEQFRNGLFGKLEDRAYFTASNLDSYRFLSLAYIQANQPQEAWFTAELAQARSFLELLINKQAYRKTYQRIQQITFTINNLQAQKKPSQARIQYFINLRKKISKKLIAKTLTLNNRSLSKAKLYRALTQTITSKKIVAVQFSAWEGDKPFIGYILSKSGLKIFSAGKSSNIIKLAKRFRHLASRPLIRRIYQPQLLRTILRDNRKEFLTVGKKLFHHILAPVLKTAQKEGAKTILIIPDGPLDALPFAAIPLSGSKKESINFFGCHYPFLMSQSSSIFTLLSDSKKKHSHKKQIIALGDIKEKKITTPSGRELLFPYLTHVKQELAAIKKQAQQAGWQFQAITKEQASKKRIKQLSNAKKLQNSAIIHFATHTLFNTKNAAMNGIILAGTTSSKALLTLQEVLSLKLKNNHIVLSSCNSAIGKRIKGEGMKNFIRAFTYAGATQVTASLWPVYDLSTAQYMSIFYKFLFSKMSISEAHQLTRKEMVKKWGKSPCHWAAFVNYGTQ